MPLQILREEPVAAPLPPIRGFEVQDHDGDVLRFTRGVHFEDVPPNLVARVVPAEEGTTCVVLAPSDVEQLRDALNDWLEQERGRSIFTPGETKTIPAERPAEPEMIGFDVYTEPYAERLKAAFEGPLPGLLADPELYIERKERR